MSRRDDDLEPRRRPQQARAKATLDAVFEAMLQVIERQEETDPTVQAIADRAGISVGSLYQYFPSKASLASSLMRFYVQRRVALLEQELANVEGMAGEAAATLLVERFLAFQSAQHRVERRMVRYLLRIGDPAVVTELDARMRRLIERFLESLGAQVRDVDLPMAAFLLLNTLRSAALVALYQEPAWLDDPTFRRELTQLVVRYLRA